MTALVLGLGAAALPALAEGQGAPEGGRAMGPRGGGMHMFDFAALDANKDGKVTQDEIAAAREARVQALDTDKDGFLSPEELTAAEMQAAGERAQRRISAQDSDGDGKLSLAEAEAPMMRGNMFARIDTDGDGAISEAEFQTAQAKFMERRGHRDGKPGAAQ